MQTITVPVHLTSACPISSLQARHFLGPYASPCRCTELEATLEANAGRAEHSYIDTVGLRPRFVSALAHAGIDTTQDLADWDIEALVKVKGFNKVGQAALIYLMARRGLQVAGVTDLPADEYPRISWQAAWEAMSETAGG